MSEADDEILKKKGSHPEPVNHASMCLKCGRITTMFSVMVNKATYPKWGTLSEEEEQWKGQEGFGLGLIVRVCDFCGAESQIISLDEILDRAFMIDNKLVCLREYLVKNIKLYYAKDSWNPLDSKEKREP